MRFKKGAAEQATAPVTGNQTASDGDGGASDRSSGSSVTHVCVFQDAGWLGDVLGQVDSRMHDYVMLFADDIELQQPVDWRLLLALQQLHGLDVLTGCAQR